MRRNDETSTDKESLAATAATAATATGSKIFYDKNVTPYFARLFCFYDGKDKRLSEIKFKSERSAREYMKSFGTYEELP